MRRPACAVLLVLAALLLGACATTAVTPRSSSKSTSTPWPVTRSAGGATSYVALGDSYSAAPGVPDTDIAGGCIRSDHDYPHLLAASQHLALTDVTCSAATTWNLTTRQRIVEVSVPPQLEALKPTTRLVTLGIGGNDLDLFGTVLDRCLRGIPHCLAGVAVAQDMRVVRHRLATALRRIHHQAPAAQVVLVGYPQLVAADGSGCAALRAPAAVLRQVHGLIADFSSMMRQAAATGSATYVDLIAPSAGHDICSASPWINGPTATDQAWAFHPLPAEQQAVARLIARTLG